jgi:type IV pilus assembly protein PilA
MGRKRTFPLRRRLAPARGYTLVELLAAVAVVGILAALAIVSFRRYMQAAKSGEAKGVISGIRGAQAVYLSEHLAYANCSSSLTSYYPRAAPDDKKASFTNDGHLEAACWRRLNVSADGAVYYVYSVVAGAGNTALPTSIPGFTTSPTWPAAVGARPPWFVVHALGDVDADGVNSSFWASSFDRDVRIEREDE